MSLHAKLISYVCGIAALAATSADAGTYISAPIVKNSQGISLGGINNNNVVTGVYYDSDNNAHGFYGTLDGTYKKFDYKGDNVTSTFPRNINDNNDIVGFATLSTYDCSGGVQFYRKSNGNFVTITKNDADLMGVTQGIASSGKTVGDYVNSKCTTQTSFTSKKGVYSADVSTGLNSKIVDPRGLNTNGDIVGYYVDKDNATHGFLLKNGRATQIDYPSKKAQTTVLEDINDSGLAVGQWVDSDGNQFGFTLDTSTMKFNAVLPSGSTTSQVLGLNNAGFLIVNTDVGNYVYCPLSKSKCAAIGKGKEASLGPNIHPALGEATRYVSQRAPLPALHTSVHMMTP